MIEYPNPNSPSGLSPQEFADKLSKEFLPALQNRLDKERPGSVILEAKQGQMGIDITLEDTNGQTETYCVDPYHQTWIKVYDTN